MDQTFYDRVNACIAGQKKSSRSQARAQVLDFEKDVAEGRAITEDTYVKIVARLYRNLREIAGSRLGFKFTDDTVPNYDCTKHGRCENDFLDLDEKFQAVIAMYVSAFLGLTVGCCGQRPQLFCSLTFNCFKELVTRGDAATSVNISALEKVERSHVPLWLDRGFVAMIRHILGFYAACVYGLPLVDMVNNHPECLVLPHLHNSRRDTVRLGRTVRETLFDLDSRKACSMNTAAFTNQLRHCFQNIEGYAGFVFGKAVQGQHLRDFLWWAITGMILRHAMCTIQVLRYNRGVGWFAARTRPEFIREMQLQMNSGTSVDDTDGGPLRYSYVAIKADAINHAAAIDVGPIDDAAEAVVLSEDEELPEALVGAAAATQPAAQARFLRELAADAGAARVEAAAEAHFERGAIQGSILDEQERAARAKVGAAPALGTTVEDRLAALDDQLAALEHRRLQLAAWEAHLQAVQGGPAAPDPAAAGPAAMMDFAAGPAMDDRARPSKRPSKKARRKDKGPSGLRSPGRAKKMRDSTE